MNQLCKTVSLRTSNSLLRNKGKPVNPAPPRPFLSLLHSSLSTNISQFLIRFVLYTIAVFNQASYNL